MHHLAVAPSEVEPVVKEAFAALDPMTFCHHGDVSHVFWEQVLLVLAQKSPLTVVKETCSGYPSPQELRQVKVVEPYLAPFHWACQHSWMNFPCAALERDDLYLAESVQRVSVLVWVLDTKPDWGSYPNRADSQATRTSSAHQPSRD